LFFLYVEGYIAFVEELPGANTQGVTLDEARTNLHEAVALVLEANRTLAQEAASGKRRDSGAPDGHGVKRRELVRHLERHGCELLREGANHSIYVNRAAGKTSAVLRHSEINDDLAKKICKDLNVPSQ
jgi:mRNA interferase HicA